MSAPTIDLSKNGVPIPVPPTLGGAMADTAVIVGATPADKHSFALLLGARDVVRSTVGKTADAVMAAARKLHVTGAIKAAGRTLGWLVGRAEWIISAAAGLGLAPLAALAVSTKTGRSILGWAGNAFRTVTNISVYVPCMVLSKFGAPGRFLARCIATPYEKITVPLHNKIAQGVNWLYSKAPADGKPMQTVALIAKSSILINAASKFLPQPWGLALSIIVVPIMAGRAYRKPAVVAVDPAYVARVKAAGEAVAHQEAAVSVPVKTLQKIGDKAVETAAKIDAVIEEVTAPQVVTVGDVLDNVNAIIDEELAKPVIADIEAEVEVLETRLAKIETEAERRTREIEADAEKTAHLQYSLDEHEAAERERLAAQKAEADRVLEELTAPEPPKKLSARDAEVLRVMQEKGLSKTQAKAYVRQNGIAVPVPA